MDQVDKIQSYFRHHRIALYAIVMFMIFITYLLVVVARQVSDQQAMQTSSYASEISLSNGSSLANLQMDGNQENEQNLNGEIDQIDPDGHNIRSCPMITTRYKCLEIYAQSSSSFAKKGQVCNGSLDDQCNFWFNGLSEEYRDERQCYADGELIRRQIGEMFRNGLEARLKKVYGDEISCNNLDGRCVSEKPCPGWFDFVKKDIDAFCQNVDENVCPVPGNNPIPALPVNP